MGLNLTGKGSILNAIGGALNTAANAAVAGVKNIGDIIGADTAALTGNQQAEQNANAAIQNNNSNLSGGNFLTNLGGLSQDTGVTAMARAGVGSILGAGTDLGNLLSNQNLTTQEGIGDPLGLTSFATNHNPNDNLSSARTMAGNTIMTGVNIATMGKGKALEGLVEKGVGKVIRSEERRVGKECR